MMGINRAADYVFVVRASTKAIRNWCKRNGYTASQVAQILARVATLERSEAAGIKAEG